ncbi:MAG: hypothetical protein AAFQ89_21030, partial [Cyanobacteria bacterium J06626_18]
KTTNRDAIDRISICCFRGCDPHSRLALNRLLLSFLEYWSLCSLPSEMLVVGKVLIHTASANAAVDLIH